MNSIFHQHRLALFILLAIVVDFIPILKLPFLWSETFFHEISHGLAAILTGGSIVSISLDFIGSGLCISQGGLGFVVSFSGYFGSAVWGMFVYLAADNIRAKSARIIMAVFIIVLVMTMVLWAKGISTYIILGIMISLFAVFFKYCKSVTLKYVLQFIGAFVLLDAIRSPLALIDGRDRGDGASLYALTYVPEIVWIGVWMLTGLVCLYVIYHLSYKKPEQAKTTWV